MRHTCRGLVRMGIRPTSTISDGLVSRNSTDTAGSRFPSYLSEKWSFIIFFRSADAGWSFDLFLVVPTLIYPFKQADRGLLLKLRTNFTTKSVSNFVVVCSSRAICMSCSFVWSWVSVFITKSTKWKNRSFNTCRLDVTAYMITQCNNRRQIDR